MAPRSWHTKNEHAIIKAMNAKRQGKGVDGLDSQNIPFEVRESKKTPKFRLQKNVHEELVKRGGYYIFKQGENMLKIDAKDVTPLLKPGKWSFDRKPEYAYKFLACEKIGLTGGGVLDKLAKSTHARAVEYYSKYFTS